MTTKLVNRRRVLPPAFGHFRPAQYMTGEEEFVTRIYGIQATNYLTSDSNNGDVLCAQQVFVQCDCIVESFHMRINTAVGVMRMGLYNVGNALLVDSGEFTPGTGLNTKTIADFALGSGTHWLTHHPSSDSLAYVNSSGVHDGQSKTVADAYGALPATFPGGASSFGTDWPAYITVRVAVSDLPVPGFIVGFHDTMPNWTDPWIMDELFWYNQSSGQTWSIQQVGATELRFELRPGEDAIDVGGERSELSSGFGWPSAPMTIRMTFEVLIETSAAAIAAEAPGWWTLMQLHGGGPRPFWIGIDSGKLQFYGNNDSGTSYGYTAPSLFTSNQWYHWEIECLTGASGYCKVWLDGVQVINFTGNIPVGVGDNYAKFGCYRENDVSALTAVQRYRNIDFDPEQVSGSV